MVDGVVRHRYTNEDSSGNWSFFQIHLNNNNKIQYLYSAIITHCSMALSSICSVRLISRALFSWTELGLFWGDLFRQRVGQAGSR